MTLPAALLLSATLAVSLATPASAAVSRSLAPGIEVHFAVLGAGTGHNTWTATVLVPGGVSPDPDAPAAACLPRR